MKRILVLAVGAVLALGAAAEPEAKRYDVLELPAVPSAIAAQSLSFSLTRAGERLIATGIRGHILYSDDQGHSWTQAESVPVRSSLLDATFVSPEQGWVVGHEGVILHTLDGGRTWERQLDGVQLARIGLEHYRALAGQHPDDARYALLLEEMQLALDGNADRPFFGILMRDEREGIAAGAYGLLFATTDGGASWQPVMERLDLEQYVHLFSHAELPAAGDDAPLRVLAGEMGTILVEDPASGEWRRQEFPYDGSMFTIVATGDGALVAGGLRGLVFRSEDRGASWSEVGKPQTPAIVAATTLADGRVVLAAQDGTLLASRDDGRSFEALPAGAQAPVSDLLEGRPGELVLSGAFGLRVIDIGEAERLGATAR